MALIDYMFGIILVVGVLISSWNYLSPIAYEDSPSSVDAETVFAWPGFAGTAGYFVFGVTLKQFWASIFAGEFLV